MFAIPDFWQMTGWERPIQKLDWYYAHNFC
ncbi:hypothetical protein EMIT0P12_20022 [Pseudomonas sp. IT-P12]